MRLLGAVVFSLVLASLAAAEPAKQGDQKKEQPQAAKETAKSKEPARAKPATKAKKGAEKAEVSKVIVDAYAAMPLAERVAIQSDLIWTGDYNGIVSGEFAERSVAAVRAFQKRNGGKETGVLSPQERAALSAAAKPKQDTVGWRMVDDGNTGARIGIPGKLVPQQSVIIGGTRWASSRGEYSVESFRITQPGTTLAAVFERMKKEPAGRRTEYSVMRDNFLVLSGLQNLKKFYVRAQIRGEEVRGITILYDQAMAGIMEPVVVAMSSAYAAFPGGPAAPPPRRKVEYASGIAVGSGQIVTSREALEGCYAVTVAGIGGVDRVADDKASGVALLRVNGGDLKPVAFASAAPKGADVTLLGVADPQQQGGGGAVSAAKARVSDTLALEPAPALGFDGAAALDAQGRLAGLAVLNAGTAAKLVPAEALRGFLDAHKVAPAQGAAASAEAAKVSVLRVICVRR